MKNDELQTSGMLERYLLGETNALETAEVESLLASDPRLKELYQTMEADLERMALEQAIAPPDAIKESVLIEVKKSPKVVSSSIPYNKYYLLVAATLILALAITSFWMFAQWNAIQSDLEVVQSEKDLLIKNFKTQQTQWNTLQDKYDLVMAPDTKKYILLGNDKAPNAQAIGYVNDKNKAVLLDTQRLPPLPNNRDYQLWADVRGTMINMGVIQKGEMLLAMNYIDEAESLNITVEPLGGSDHPTVENLIANVLLN